MIDAQFDVPDPRSSSATEPLGPGDAAVMEPLAVTLTVTAGGAVPTRWLAANRVLLQLTPQDQDALSPSVVDALFDGVVRAWFPASAALRSSALIPAVRGRGGYAPVIGYRTWLSAQVGAVSAVADGLTLETREEGAPIVTPDDWSADQVAAALLATLEGNGISEIPREVLQR